MFVPGHLGRLAPSPTAPRSPRRRNYPHLHHPPRRVLSPAGCAYAALRVAQSSSGRYPPKLHASFTPFLLPTRLLRPWLCRGEVARLHDARACASPHVHTRCRGERMPAEMTAFRLGQGWRPCGGASASRARTRVSTRWCDERAGLPVRCSGRDGHHACSRLMFGCVMYVVSVDRRNPCERVTRDFWRMCGALTYGLLLTSGQHRDPSLLTAEGRATSLTFQASIHTVTVLHDRASHTLHGYTSDRRNVLFVCNNYTVTKTLTDLATPLLLLLV